MMRFEPKSTIYRMGISVLRPTAAWLRPRTEPGRWLQLAALVLCWALLVVTWAAVIPFAAVRSIHGVPTAPPPLTLQRTPDGQPLAGRLGFLMDPGASLRPEDVASDAMQGAFRYPPDILRSSADQGVWWLRFTVSASETPGTEAGQGRWLVALPTVATCDLRLYGPFDAKGAELSPPVVTGAAYPYTSRPLGSERMVLPFQLPGPGTYRFFIRADSSVGQVYALRIWKPAEYLVSLEAKRLFDGICYGVLAGMLIYNLLLLLTFRERIYAYYLLNCAAALLTIAGFNGHLAHYLLPDWPGATLWLFSAAPVLWIVFAVQFGRSFLALAAHAPMANTVLRALAVLAMGSVAASFSGSTAWLTRITEVSLVVGSGVMVAGGIAAARAGFRPALIYLGGLGLLVTAAVALMLANWGATGWSSMLVDGLQLGVCAELVLFSVALGSRIRLLWQTQQELHARTRWLTKQVQTDYLTGVANRAGLAARAEQILATGSPMALMLLDLDQFKPVNDQFGHAAGDRMLEAIASRLRGVLRDGDLVARLGGDEFVVLLPGQSDRAALSVLAHQIVERVRAPVRYGQASMVVTSSVGVSRFPQNARDLDGLLRAADRAMYHCKRHRHLDFAFPEDVVAPDDAWADEAGSPRSTLRSVRRNG